MPLYEYQCKQCGHRFEKIQSFSAPEVKECPVCQGEVEKLLSAPAIQFKGSGWYVSDYGKGGSKNKPEGKTDSQNNAKTDNSSASSKENSSEKSSSESKPSSSDSSSTSTPAATTPTSSSTPASKKD